MAGISKIKLPDRSVYDINADTVDGQHASAFLGGGFVYKSYLEGGNSSDLNDYVTDYHGFVYNCTNTPTPNEYGFLDVSNFYGGGFLPSLPENGGVIRQIFTSYSTFGTYTRLRRQNVWENWVCLSGSGKNASGTITGLANGTAKTVSLPFSPVFVLFHSNGHVVQGGFALSCGTNSFTITPASVSTMGSTAVGYIAFRG